MFYEVAGESGPPVVLLHGAMGGAFVWGRLIEALSAGFRTYAPEQRGGARTPDVDGPFHYETLVDDTTAFVEEVIGEPVHIVGASDGGIIGLGMALRNPKLVKSLTTYGANYHYEGLLPEAGLDSSADDPAWQMARDRYAQLSPDGPEHWPIVYKKLMKMARTEPSWTVNDLARIEPPVLVMVGDDDIVRLDHSRSLFEALPNGRLAVVPGASHVGFLERPELVNAMIHDFMEHPGPPQTMMPIRRA